MNLRTSAHSFGVASVILFAAILRFWAIDFGLPLHLRPDEFGIIATAYSFFSGDLNPHDLRYPTLWMYLLSICYWMYGLVGMVLQKFDTRQDFYLDMIISSPRYILIDRVLAALFGVLTVYLLYRCGRILFDRNRGLLAAFFLAISPLHVRDSHFGVTDVPQTFFIVCAFYFAVCLLKDQSWKNYLLLGLFSGLAASTKYAGGLIWVSGVAASYLAFDQSDRPRPWIKLFASVMLAGGAFFLTSPYIILDPKETVSGLLYEWNHLRKGHEVPLGTGWWYHLRYSLFYGFGAFLFLLAIFGAFRLSIKSRSTFLVCLIFPVIYYAIAGQGQTVFVRYMIPVVPFAALLAAYGFFEMYNLVGQNRVLRSGFISAAGVFVFITNFLPSYKTNYYLSQTDTREIAVRWICQNIKNGSSLYQPIQQKPNFLETAVLGDRAFIEYQMKKYFKVEIDPDLSNRIMKVKRGCSYSLWKYKLKDRAFSVYDEPVFSEPDYIVLQRSVLTRYNAMPAEIETIVRNRYQCVQTFRGSEHSTSNWYDQIDAFYLPLKGFKQIERPGPEILIYRRIQADPSKS